MRINKNELRAAVDIDETLITRKNPRTQITIELDYYGEKVIRQPMLNNIRLLKAYKKRGYEVTVHSANGWAWATEVIKKLGLEEYVDEVGTKFLKSLDDKQSNDWLPQVYESEEL